MKTVSTAADRKVLIVKSTLRFLQLAAVVAAVTLASPALAVTDIMWWHAMSGELGRQLDKLAANFNASQSEYRIVPSYKGNYTETVTAAIFAFRSRSQPAIVQVSEIATATMMAARGAIYPVFELMRDEQGAFSTAAYLRPLPAITPTSPATCCHSRSTPRRRSCIITRTCFAPPASNPKGRRRTGAESARGGRGWR